MKKENKFRLHPAVFYRLYDDLTVLYHTAQQKVYTFAGNADLILNMFSETNSVSAVLDSLKKSIQIDDYEAFSRGIEDFVHELIKKEILMSQFTQEAITDTLETEVAASFYGKHLLYSVTLELTYLCNEKCRHCYVTKGSKKELETKQIFDIIDQLALENVLNIVFTGGEVFVRKDAFEIIEYAYSKGFVIDIFTNGTLLSGDDIIRLKRVYPRSVHFSLYSHIKEKHEAITMVDGSFEKTVNAILQCSSVGIPTNIKMPIFQETAGDIKGMVELANRLGVTIELGSNITPKKDGDLSPTEMQISSFMQRYEVQQLIDELVPSPEPSQESSSDKLCGAGERSISINPYGEVFPCNMFPLMIGDLTKQTLSEIWNYSDELLWWRDNNYRTSRVGCEYCDLANDCYYCPGEAMLREGNPLAKYDAACVATENAKKLKQYKEVP